MLKSVANANFKSNPSLDCETRLYENGDSFLDICNLAIKSLKKLVKDIKDKTSNNDYLMHWADNFLTIYYPELNKGMTIKMKFNIPAEADIVSLQNRLYIFANNSATNNFHEIDLTEQSLIQRASLLLKKRYHSPCTSNSYIFSIGGNDENNTSLKDGEKYSLATKKWEPLPDLQEPRCKSGTAYLKDCLYSIFGIHSVNGSSTNINTLEKLNLMKGLYWEQIKIDGNLGKGWTYLRKSENDECLILSNDQTMVQILVLSTESPKVLTHRIPMETSTNFTRSANGYYDPSRICFFEDSKQMYVYSKDEQFWSIVSTDSILKACT